jgi:hypothetical protein
MRAPKRFMAYGAYNLCFDREWAKDPGTGNLDYFDLMVERDFHVNLVKVIVFRKSTLELSALDPRRIVPLYNRQRAINGEFLDNLKRMVRKAESRGIWVEVCVFSYHSVLRGEGPENAPAAFDVSTLTGHNNCENLAQWFNPAPADPTGRERLAQQQALVTALGNALKPCGNVLWELGNELRIDGAPSGDRKCDARTMRAGDCQLLAWLNLMRETLVKAVSTNGVAPSPLYISTSTGVHFDQTRPYVFVGNEQITFSKNPQACAGVPPLPATFFDFHAGQWDAMGDFQRGIAGARKRASDYNAAAPLIINDDGSLLSDEPDPKHTEFWQFARVQAALKIKEWAIAAFKAGAGFSSKQQYTPEPFDFYALDAMKAAWEAVPLPGGPPPPIHRGDDGGRGDDDPRGGPA